MAQTTSSVNAKDGVIEISTNGSTWTDISGFANKVEPGGGDRLTGTMFTFSGDTPILQRGKRETIKLKVSIVYTEGSSDPFEVVRAAYEDSTALYVRWTIKAASTGNFRFTSTAGIVKSVIYPPADAASPDPVMFEFEIEVSTITKSVI